MATARPCPKCGGSDRFYLIARPKSGGPPFWICNQCRHTESAEPGTAIGVEPIRYLTPEEIRLAQRGYDAVAQWCAAALWSSDGAAALAFLRQRGLTDATIHAARLGFHPDVRAGGVGDALWHRDRDLYEGARLGGLLGPQGRPKSVLRGVITIPYFRAGACVLIRARCLRANMAKYLSPAGVALYAGARPSLYQGDLLDQDGIDTVLLTEGEFKALLPWQHGIAAVAQPGVGYLPDAFIEALGGKTVIVCYDVEARSSPFQLSPGELWTIRAVERLTGIAEERAIGAALGAIEELKREATRRDAGVTMPEAYGRLDAQLQALEARVQSAQAQLQTLRRLRLTVKVLRLPRRADTTKVDLDGFVQAHGPEALRDLIRQAEPAHLWHAAHSGGEYRYEHGGIHNGTLIANYQARIVETVFQSDGQQMTAIQRLALRSPSGRVLSVEIPGADWADDRAARQALREGLREGTFDDDPRAVLRAIRVLSNQGDPPAERTVYTCTGWEPVRDRWHFLASDGAIAADGPTTAVRAEIDPEAIGNHYALCGAGDAQAGAAAWLAFLRGAVCPQPLALIMAAQAALPLIHRWAGSTDRTMLWLYHQSGALKTSLTRASVMALYGPAFTAERAGGAPVPKWDATSVGLGLLVFYYRDMPLLIDDYKQGVIHIDQFKRFLHNYSESTGRTRGTKEQKVGRINPARCIVFSTAEDLPTAGGDYGMEARLLALQLHPDAVQSDALAALQRAGAAGHLAAFWRQFVQQLARELDLHGEAGIRATIQNAMRADDDQLPGHRRAAGALRQNRAAWLVLSRWLEHAKYITADERAALDAAHLEARTLLADVLLGRQRESKPALIFLNVLAELLQSGDLVVEREGMACPRCTALLVPSDDGWYCSGTIGGDKELPCNYHLPTSRIVGFVAEDGIGLYAEKAFREVSRVRNDQRQPFAFSSSAIWQQLDADGLLVAKGKDGRPQVQRRNPARRDDRGYGKPAKVLLIRGDVFADGPPDDEIGISLDPMGSMGSMGSQGRLPQQHAIGATNGHGITAPAHGITAGESDGRDPIDPTVIPSMGSHFSAAARAEPACDPMIPWNQDTHRSFSPPPRFDAAQWADAVAAWQRGSVHKLPAIAKSQGMDYSTLLALLKERAGPGGGYRPGEATEEGA